MKIYELEQVTSDKILFLFAVEKSHQEFLLKNLVPNFFLDKSKFVFKFIWLATISNLFQFKVTQKYQ